MKTGRRTSADGIVRRIVESSVDAVRPSTLFESGFRLSGNYLDAFGTGIDLSRVGGVKCISIGKCAESMAHEVRKKLGKRASGVIATPVDKGLGVEGFDFYKTGHPLPDSESLKAGERIRRLVAESARNDLLLFLISGGGSASIFVPIDGVSPDEANRLMKLLFDNGVPIDKVNLVRRHISLLGGGKLSALAPGRTKLSLIISDVVGDDPHSIASGPTVADETTSADALRFLESSGVMEQVPEAVPKALMEHRVHHPPSITDDGVVRIIASNRDALEAAERVGLEGGFNTLVLTRFWESDVEEAARATLSVARSIELDGEPVSSPALLVAGGETTVRLTGGGKGGRNQQMVLCALRDMARLREAGTKLEGTTIFSFGTDGKDGNSEAAGALASLDTLGKVLRGMKEIEDFILRNDSNAFFARYGGLITTGPTDTNVMDVFGAIIE